MIPAFILPAIGFFVRFRSFLMLAGFLIATGSFGWFMYSKGYNASENKSINQFIEIREKQNEIRNNRPDDVHLIDSLRRGKF